MAEVIRMPLLSDTMKEGKIVQWLKKVGDDVASDDVLAEVQTDKATMEVVPYVDGTLLYIGVPEGEAAAVNQIIAIIGDQGEDFSSLLEANATSSNPTEVQMPDTNDNKLNTANTDNNQTASIALPDDLEIVRMPLLSDTMKQGKIVAWLKEVGDSVGADDVLAEVETDKATMEVVGYADGTLLYKGVDAGDSVEVNGVLAIVGNKSTDINKYLPTILAEQPGENGKAQEVSDTQTAHSVAPVQPIKTKAMPEQMTNTENIRVKASPLARKMAEGKGISLAGIQGSGDGGRIIKRDIDNYKEVQRPVAQTSSAPAASESFTDTPVSQMREVIARRLGESKFSAPHFYLKISVEMDALLDMRKKINALSEPKISVNDMIIKACAMALEKHPAVNSSWLGDKIRTNHHIHIGSAVAIEEGLIVPVIKFARQKNLGQIATEANTLYEKAKSGKLQPQEFTGNTFTISNLGMMGIEDFTAIINPPDACILAVGKTTPTPIVNEAGEVVVRNMMRLTLSCDHRVVDGAVGARFLQTLKECIEQPLLMLL